MELIEELKWRGFLKDISSEQLLEKFLAEKAPVYIGFDPTAKSLHLGNYIPICLLRLLLQKGIPTIGIAGGATGFIGDPSGKANERVLLDESLIKENVTAIAAQLKKLIGEEAIIVDNYDWCSKLSMIEFLRDYGKHFPINYLLAKDVVSSRLEAGISFTEFSYNLIQAIDFHHLYQQYGCKIQFGGSDQWGNITSGIELIRRRLQVEVAGATIPLLTTSNGAKFGKSEGNALFLDGTMTSPYTLYQYLLNVSDDDVIKYLKLFTNYSKERIEQIEKEIQEDLSIRKGQKILAFQLVSDIHSEQDAENAKKISELLFSNKIKQLTASEIKIALSTVPSVKSSLPVNICDALITVGACKSKREAREFIANKSITVNGEIITDSNLILDKESAIENELFLFRRGKKMYFILQID